jgi:hypothetical protein
MPEPVDPPAPPADPPAPPDPVDYEAEAEKWKALARKHERGQLDALGFKSKDEIEELRAAAKRLADLEEADKTEAQKAIDAAAAAEGRATKAETELLRIQVAIDKGVPLSDADLLTGSTREEMEKVAERLAGLIKPGDPPKPAGSADGGPQGDPPSPVKQLTRADLKGMTATEIVAARKAGQLNDLTGATT